MSGQTTKLYVFPTPGQSESTSTNNEGRRRRIGTPSKLQAEPSHTYKLIDVGASLLHKCYGRYTMPSRVLKSVLKRADTMGIEKIVVKGTNVTISTAAKELTKSYPGKLFYTAGIHPHNAKTWNEDKTLGQLEELASDPACVGIGETGLDFLRNFSEPEDQELAFEKQVELACRLKKPLLLHERDAHAKLMEILMKYEGQLPTCIIHCFTGTEAEAKVYVEKGFYLGVTGFITQQDNPLKEILINGSLPLSSIVLESNSPFMEPRVGKGFEAWDSLQNILECLPSPVYWSPFPRNEPAKLPVVCEIVAHLLEVEASAVAVQTAANACKVFSFPTEE